MKTKNIFVIGIIAVILFSGIAIAASGLVIDDFEDGNLNKWDFGSDDGDEFVIETNTVYEGDYSAFATAKSATLSNTFTADTYSNTTFALNVGNSIAGSDDQYASSKITMIGDSSDGNNGFIFLMTHNSSGYMRIQTDNDDGNGFDTTTNFKPNTNTWYLYRVEFDYGAQDYDLYVEDTNGNVVYSYINANMVDVGSPSGQITTFKQYRLNSNIGGWYIDGIVTNDKTLPSQIPSYNVSGKVVNRDQLGINNASITHNKTANKLYTNAGGEYGTFSLENGTYRFTADKAGFHPTNRTIVINGSDRTVNFRLLKTELRFNLHVNGYMKHGSTQPYRVTYTNVTGYNIIPKDVTNQATVTSSDPSNISVDTTNNQLVATSDKSVNTQVTITAKYTNSDGINFTSSKTVTVANQTIDNIDIMPGSQYPNAFLGVGEDGTVFGMGSMIQWLFLLIIFAGLFTYLTSNEFVGIGVYTIGLILFWLMGNVTVGLFIPGLLFGIAIGLVLMDIDRQANMTVETEGSNEI